MTIKLNVGMKLAELKKELEKNEDYQKLDVVKQKMVSVFLDDDKDGVITDNTELVYLGSIINGVEETFEDYRKSELSKLDTEG